MSRKKSSAPTISLATLARCAGIPVSTLYTRQPDARGPLPLTQAIVWLEGELSALYADKTPSRRVRKLEDALTSLRVQRSLHRIQNRPKRRQSPQGQGHNNAAGRTGAKPHYDPGTGALLRAPELELEVEAVA